MWAHAGPDQSRLCQVLLYIVWIFSARARQQHSLWSSLWVCGSGSDRVLYHDECSSDHGFQNTTQVMEATSQHTNSIISARTVLGTLLSWLASSATAAMDWIWSHSAPPLRMPTRPMKNSTFHPWSEYGNYWMPCSALFLTGSWRWYNFHHNQISIGTLTMRLVNVKCKSLCRIPDW